VFELLVHHLDVLRWLIGPLAVSTAHLGRLSGAIRAEDTAAIALVGRHGLPVLIDACYCVHGAPDHVVDNLEIIGTKGTISLSDTNLSLTGARTASMSWAFDALYDDAYEGALREFVTGLLKDRAFETEAGDNLHVLQLVEDIYAAAGWSG
jgi:predicted dehydrogenase